MDLSIIIVNYNDWNNLRNCISSINVEMPYKIYVVDNASKPHSYSEELQKNINVVYIKSNINGGYSFGNNLGLERSLIDECEYFLISNTDIIYNNDSINSLLHPLLNRECDVVGPKVNLPNDKLQDIINVLPGMKSPTVLPLAEAGWSSVHSVISKNQFWDIIDELKKKGAQGILVCPIEKMVL